MVGLLHSVFEVWAAVAVSVSGTGAGVGNMCREDTRLIVPAQGYRASCIAQDIVVVGYETCVDPRGRALMVATSITLLECLSRLLCFGRGSIYCVLRAKNYLWSG